MEQNKTGGARIRSMLVVLLIIIGYVWLILFGGLDKIKVKSKLIWKLLDDRRAEGQKNEYSHLSDEELRKLLIKYSDYAGNTKKEISQAKGNVDLSLLSDKELMELVKENNIIIEEGFNDRTIR